MQIKRYWEGFVTLLFPRLCAACDHVLVQQETFLCTACQFHLPIHDHSLFFNNETVQRLKGKATFEMAAAYLSFSKSSSVQQLIHKLKYAGAHQVGIFLGKEFGMQLLSSPFFEEIDLIVPIPLHSKKRRQRGYNQSEYIAMGIAAVLQRPVNTKDFIRTVNTSSQTTMRRMDRYENVEGIFDCLNVSSFQDKRILLVDDVMTTGSTVAAAACALEKLTNCKVFVAVLAIA